MRSINFISGLPRSGSTLLAAILRQNPALTASMSTPVCSLVASAMREMSNAERQDFFDEGRREAVAQAIIGACYESDSDVIDTNRHWTAYLPLLRRLYPKATVICCVRNLGWVINSFERVFAANPLLVSKMFKQPRLSVYDRAQSLTDEQNGVIGRSYAALKEAWFGEHANHLMVIDYDRLVQAPRITVAEIYERCGWEHYAHDFEHVDYSEPLFDRAIATPGLHSVNGRVHKITSTLLIPPDLFARYADSDFWNLPGYNLRSVAVLSPLKATADENSRERERAA